MAGSLLFPCTYGLLLSPSMGRILETPIGVSVQGSVVECTGS